MLTDVLQFSKHFRERLLGLINSNSTFKSAHFNNFTALCEFHLCVLIIGPALGHLKIVYFRKNIYHGKKSTYIFKIGQCLFKLAQGHVSCCTPVVALQVAWVSFNR